MTTPSNALQAALYTRLAAQVSGVPIYDHVPQNSAFPYIELGERTMVQWDAKGKEGWDYTYTLHVWTKAAGRKSAQTILSSVYDALHHQESNITPSGFRVVVCRCEFEQVFQELGNDGETDHYYHGVATYRFLIEPSS